ncbi:uncharacterized protein LOC143449941 [Clavelina lepadiformis]|uniref:uncharacterized protein LOC143449941 n=1 Tax=Clavelina lepadiformis TaxID=159417 RepID=UPI0040421D0F
MVFKCVICLTLIAWASSAAFSPEDFQACQQKYDASIGELVASEGISAADAVWRILFSLLDLNQNQQLSASEIVLKLDTDDIISSSEMSNLLQNFQAWINAAKSEINDQELSFQEFKYAVGKTIGRVGVKKTSGASFLEATSCLCKYFEKNIPSVVSIMRSLYNCTQILKQDQLDTISTSSKRFVVNTWKGVFSTIDQNSDDTITNEEIASTYNFYNPAASEEDPINDLEAYLGPNALNTTTFFTSINNLLFGMPGNKVWLNVTSSNELKGKRFTCFVLRDTRNDVIMQLEKNINCANSYQKMLNRTLGNDAGIAPFYVFTVADADKDGLVTVAELDQVLKTNKSFEIFFNQADPSLMDQGSLEKYMPDNVVSERSNAYETVFELSKLSCQQHEVWNSFCKAMTDAVSFFPTSFVNVSALAPSSNAPANVSLLGLIENLKHQLSSQKPRNIPGNIIKSLNDLTNIFAGTPGKTVEAITPKSITFSSQATQNTDFVREMTSSNANQLQTTAAIEVTSPNSEHILSNVVRELFENLKNESMSKPSSKNDSEVMDILTNINDTGNVTNIETSSSNSSLSAEEEELYELLSDLRKKETSAQIGLPTGSVHEKSDHDKEDKSILSPVEQQLQELLKEAMKDISE